MRSSYRRREHSKWILCCIFGTEKSFIFFAPESMSERNTGCHLHIFWQGIFFCQTILVSLALVIFPQKFHTLCKRNPVNMCAIGSIFLCSFESILYELDLLFSWEESSPSIKSSIGILGHWYFYQNSIKLVLLKKNWYKFKRIRWKVRTIRDKEDSVIEKMPHSIILFLRDVFCNASSPYKIYGG